MLIAVALGARWSVYSRDIGRNAPVLPHALQWEMWRTDDFVRGARRRRLLALAAELFQQLAARRRLAGRISPRARLGEEMPRDGEHQRLSRRLLRHDDDATASESIHAGHLAKPQSG